MFAALASPLFQTFAATCGKTRFFGLIPWYEYLTFETDPAGHCAVTNFGQDGVLGTNSGFLLIALAVVNDLIRIAAFVAVGFIIYGGIQYMTSQGSSDQTKKAQQTIINALIGLATALIATGVVSFVGNRLGSG